MSEQEQIAEFIRRRGVTRCPTACAARTSITLSAADVAATKKADDDRVATWRHRNGENMPRARIFRRRKMILASASRWAQRRKAC